MKKRVFALPIVALMSLCVVLLTGCQSGPTTEEIIRHGLEDEFTTVSVDNEDFMTSLEQSSGGDFEQLGISTEEFATAYLDGFDYEIGDIVVDENEGTATADVAVTVKPMMQIVTDFQTAFEERLATVDYATLASEDDLYALAGEVMLEVTRATEPESEDCTFGFTRDEDGSTWNIDDDASSEMMAAMM